MVKEEFGNYRLKKSTLEYLRRMKKAFELSYGVDLTNDDFIHKMAASVEEDDVAVWDIFCELDQTMDRLAAKGRARSNKEGIVNKTQ